MAFLEGAHTWSDSYYGSLDSTLRHVEGSHDYNSAAPPPSTTPNTNSSGFNPLLPHPPLDSLSSSGGESDQEDPEDENHPIRPTHSATWAGRNAVCPVIKSRMPP